jgi:hypothetical protein
LGALVENLLGNVLGARLTEGARLLVGVNDGARLTEGALLLVGVNDGARLTEGAPVGDGSVRESGVKAL